MNLETLKVYHFDKKRRLGLNSDGGYVFGELDSVQLYDCYISAGVSSEESFSRDFIEMHNMNKDNCYAFDGTIDDYPYHYTDKIQFVKKNIGSNNDDYNTNLVDLIDKYNDIFLKMDIEGGEYPWLLSMNEIQMKKFKQIVIELHGITGDWLGDFNDKKKCLEKLAESHYIIHAHGNNHAMVFDNIPDVVELTYIRKDYFVDIPKLNTTPLPTPGLDFPNHPHYNDIGLNHYPFTHY